MANKKLSKLAEARGKSEQWYIDHVVAPMTNEKGQAAAARTIGVSQATISGWLRDHGYIARLDWVRKVTPAESARIEALAERVNKYRTIPYEGEKS